MTGYDAMVAELVEEVMALPLWCQLEVVRRVLERMSPEDRARAAELLREAP